MWVSRSLIVRWTGDGFKTLTACETTVLCFVVLLSGEKGPTHNARHGQHLWKRGCLSIATLCPAFRRAWSQEVVSLPHNKLHGSSFKCFQTRDQRIRKDTVCWLRCVWEERRGKTWRRTHRPPSHPPSSSLGLSSRTGLRNFL